jgi:RNA 3'-terminal phosphate cyclase (ATP)
MLTISGQSGGGQLLRSSLTLSCLTGQPFRMNHIRAARPKPGLMRQHLTCVQAAAAISGAAVTGAERGSLELDFTPGKIQGGDYRFDIGTGGSTTLVLQTVLPALLMAETGSTVTIIGGTHNPMAPPADFLQKCWLPLLRRMGADIDLTVEKPGFMQAGGGVLQARIAPLQRWIPLDLQERGARLHEKGQVLQSRLDPAIVQRMIDSTLKILGWKPEDLPVVEATSSPGPGGILMLESAYDYVTELCSSVLETGRRSGLPASHAAHQLKAWQDSRAPVGIHLADQLLLPLAMAGKGRFATSALSDHTRSHLELIPKFLPVSFQLESSDDGVITISL